MPLRRSYARSTRYRRRTTRRVPRRSTRSTVARRPRRNRYNSRRRILNVASVKKSDTMLSAFQPATGSPSFTSGVSLTGERTFYGLWCATARDLTSGAANIPGNTALRGSNVCYMRGLKERINFRSNSGASWRWRRICFTVKGAVWGVPTELEVSPQGWTRYLFDMTNVASSLSYLQTLVFKGQAGLDYNDAFTAPVDTTRVSVKYDRVVTMNSGNAQGRYFQKKLWHPMNKNLVYSNDEAGDGMAADIKSTLGKPGMGDYYVLDILDCSTGQSADILIFNPEATLYWHEK